MFLLALFLITGCSNDTFDSKVEEGKEEINNERYEQALVFFESALEVNNSDEELIVLISQTEKMIGAINEEERGNPYEAIALFEQAKIMEGGYDKLSEQAKGRKEALQQKEQEKYDVEITRAEKLKDNGEYKEAKELLKSIIYGTELFDFLNEQYERAKEMLAEMGE